MGESNIETELLLFFFFFFPPLPPCTLALLGSFSSQSPLHSSGWSSHPSLSCSHFTLPRHRGHGQRGYVQDSREPEMGHRGKRGTRERKREHKGAAKWETERGAENLKGRTRRTRRRERGRGRRHKRRGRRRCRGEWKGRNMGWGGATAPTQRGGQRQLDAGRGAEGSARHGGQGETR